MIKNELVVDCYNLLIRFIFYKVLFLCFKLFKSLFKGELFIRFKTIPQPS
jgi:hypothetical protein